MLAIFAFVLSTCFALTNPPYEAPDEPEHLNYIQFVALHRTLPNQLDPRFRTAQGHHFPLYYCIGAVVYSMFPGETENTNAVVLNPRSKLNGGGEINVPIFIDSKTKLNNRERFLALRLMNSIFCAMTVLIIGLCARRIIAGSYWWFAPLLASTLPQWLFLSGAITNDVLASLLSASTMALALMIRRNEALNTKLIWWLLCGALAGLAILTKKSCLVLVPALIMLALFSSTNRPTRWKRTGVVLIGILVLTIGLLLRDQSLYGDFLGNRMETETLAGLVHPKGLSDAYFFNEFPRGLFRSFAGHFGWMNVLIPLPIIAPFLLVIFIGLCGSIKWVLANPSQSLFLVSIVVFSFAGVVYYNLTFTQPQGRLLFPALGALAILYAMGWNGILERMPTNRQNWLAGLLTCMMLFSAIACVFINSKFYAF